MANGTSPNYLLPIMQSLSAYAPKVDDPSQVVVGAPQPQLQQEFPQAQPAGGMDDILAALQPTGVSELVGNMGSVPAEMSIQSNDYLTTAIQEYQDAATPMLPGKLGQFEGAVRNFTSRDERDRARQAVKDTQEMSMLQQEKMRKSKSHLAQMVASQIGYSPSQAAGIGMMVYTNPEYSDRLFEDVMKANDPNELEEKLTWVHGLKDTNPELHQLAMDYLFKSNATSLQFDPESGRFLFTQGGDVTSSMPTNLSEREQNIFKSEDAMAELANMRQNFNPEFFGLKGMVRGEGGKLVDWLDIDILNNAFSDLPEFGAEREAFIQDNMRYIDQYRHDVTGAQAGLAELNRIETRLMNAMKHGKKTFMVIFNSVMKEQHAKMNRELRRNNLPFEGELPVNNYLVFSKDEIYDADDNQADIKPPPPDREYTDEEIAFPDIGGIE